MYNNLRSTTVGIILVSKVIFFFLFSLQSNKLLCIPVTRRAERVLNNISHVIIVSKVDDDDDDDAKVHEGAQPHQTARDDLEEKSSHKKILLLSLRNGEFGLLVIFKSSTSMHATLCRCMHYIFISYLS